MIFVYFIALVYISLSLIDKNSIPVKLMSFNKDYYLFLSLILSISHLVKNQHSLQTFAPRKIFHSTLSFTIILYDHYVMSTVIWFTYPDPWIFSRHMIYISILTWPLTLAVTPSISVSKVFYC